jgi:hypothetical protein
MIRSPARALAIAAALPFVVAPTALAKKETRT